MSVDSGNTAKYNYDAFGNRTMQFSTTPSVYNEYVVDLSGRAITAIQPGTSNVYTAEVFAGGRHWVTDNGSALFLGRVAQPLVLAITSEEGAPSFRASCERVGAMLPVIPTEVKSGHVGSIVSHPCKERKDGAPSIVVVFTEGWATRLSDAPLRRRQPPTQVGSKPKPDAA